MSVAVIADCHIGGPGGEPGPLIAQLDELAPPRCDRLILLGDLFHVWVASPQYETPEVRAVLEAIERARARGVTVDYIEGNRDFYVAAGPYRDRFDRVADEIAFRAGELRCLAVHGDGLDDADWQYRFWRALSKNRISRAIACALPAAWTEPFIHGTERRLGQTNFKHKVQIPEGVIRRFAERRLAEGYDLILLGHFHEAHEWRLSGGRVRLLEAWFNDRRVHWLGEEKNPAGV